MSPHIDEGAKLSPEPDVSTIPNAAPMLQEIIQLTRHGLNTAQDADLIIECGRAALSLLSTNPDLCVKLAHQKLHDVPYKEVKTCWRRLYTDATLWRVVATAEGRVGQTGTDACWIDDVVNMLDMALILTGMPNREEIVELWFAALEGVLSSHEPLVDRSTPLERPAKRAKLDNAPSKSSAFPNANSDMPSKLCHPIFRVDSMGFSAFQKKLSSPSSQTPIIIENAISHWPALSERPWSNPEYLLKRTLGGRRLVPIETGRSYTDTGWGQKISTFKDFLSTYMLNTNPPSSSPKSKPQTGYLAQHDLFSQIPSLRADISIPDLCYCDPAPNPLPHIKDILKLEDPLLNAWFGPKGTISPLHTDPYHNILAQVVGYKYVRLYAPDQTAWLYPRSVEENGVDMSNTSQVDLDEAMGVFTEIGTERSCSGELDNDAKIDELQRRRTEFEERYPGFAKAEYVECVLGPGECLYLPPGWWHYVKSLSPSFSVSFWFN